MKLFLVAIFACACVAEVIFLNLYSSMDSISIPYAPAIISLFNWKFISSQLCVAARLEDVYKNHENVTEVPKEKIEQFKSKVLGIKAISSQAADDLVTVATELKRDYPAYVFFTRIVSIFFINLWFDFPANSICYAFPWTFRSKFFRIKCTQEIPF